MIKTSTVNGSGTEELFLEIKKNVIHPRSKKNKLYLLNEKVLKIVASEKLKQLDRKKIFEYLSVEYLKPGFNLYEFARQF